MGYIVALDQGTTSSRAILFTEKGAIEGIRQKEFTQHFPRPGWVEHDPEEIWASQLEVFEELLASHQISPQQISGIGIANQRETTVVWDAETGLAIYPAIVWQDKRTSDFCEKLKEKGLSESVRNKTGLVIDSYFSGTKVNWILDHVDGARDRAMAGKLRFGTIDSWLMWKLTKGSVHATDDTNASRTLMYNIHSSQWDADMLRELDVPVSMLPEVHPSSYYYGEFEYNDVNIPILGVAGDQQAALFGQACFDAGMAKNTYGTGCFMLMNMGKESTTSANGLLTTRACSVDHQPVYALEGSVFIAGAAIQWLRDGLQLITDAAESEACAREVSSTDVIMVPAFAGLGAPYWDQYSRGAIFGLTRDAGKNHLVKAALESIAFQSRDVLMAMQEDSGIAIKSLMVDGGATANHYLMQFQADILGVEVDRPVVTESTALGAAYLAGLKARIWTMDDLKTLRKTEKHFRPEMEPSVREDLYKNWKKAVERTFQWIKD
ncbi:MAG: glycerol kinase GlpK [Cyclobacteriaceae bacterium]|nr:glycerol kinase GlpK [Cyclobacteriaceae bacterium]